MGRTAKYKKIKACDPFSKKNGGKLDLDSVGIWGLSDNGQKPKKRSKTSEKLRQQKINRRLKRMKDEKSKMKLRKMISGSDALNRPPSDDEDEFDMSDLQGTLKSQSFSEILPVEDTTPMPTVKVSTEHKDEEPTTTGVVDKKEIKEATKLLDDGSKKGGKFEGRRENESKKAYQRRVAQETRQIIKQTKIQEVNPEKRKRKKEFLKERKKRKRSSGPRDVDDDNSYGKEVDNIPFGHQVQRPPTFKSLPRGAAADQKKNGKTKKSMADEGDVRAEQLAMEKMRRKVQEQYALIKAKRRSQGDFHL